MYLHINLFPTNELLICFKFEFLYSNELLLTKILFIKCICYGQKLKSDKPQKCLGKMQTAHNPWAKCHILAFD
jgi:hypothetical protein